MTKIPHYKVTATTGKIKSLVYTKCDPLPTSDKLKLSATNNTPQFKAVDHKKRLIMGVLMQPNTPTFTNDTTLEFTKDAIETTLKKWAANKGQSTFSFSANGKSLPGIYLTESFLIDASRGIKTPDVFGKQFENGSWVVTFYVESQATYNNLITKNQLTPTFTIDGNFNKIPSHTTTTTPMKPLTKTELRAKFQASTISMKMKKEKIEDGTIVAYDGNAPKVGGTLNCVLPDGKGELPAPDGEIVLPISGVTLEILKGKIMAVKPMTSKPFTNTETLQQYRNRVNK